MFAAKDTQLTRPSGGFVIPRSLRFRASASAYLTRTVASTSDRQKATWSGWVKKGQLAITAGLFASDDGAGSRDFIRINGNDKLNVSLNENTVANLITTQVFRDPSAWYHFIVAIDTTQATAANRIKLYVNGVQITVFDTATYPSQNANFVAWNVSGKVQDVGDSSPPGAGQFFDGYMAEVNWIDGQQLTPTSFGTTSTITGVWSPIKYTGSYGTNGYHLTFNSYATTAALGTDTSGNSNTFTVNNCSVTAGVTYDSMIDVPTVTSAGSNYAVLNPLNPTGCTVTASNLTSAGTVVAGSRSSMTMSAGKWYWEVTVTAGGSADLIGLVPVTTPYDTDFSVAGSFGIGYYATSSQSLWINGVNTASYGASYTTNDVIGIKIDVTNNTVEFLKNNTSQGVINTTLLGKDWVAVHGNRSPQANTKDFNFGQRPFAYTAPTGFNSLNTYNLAAPSILKGNLYMDAFLYTGTGTAGRVLNAYNFTQDFLLLKIRSNAASWLTQDTVRGSPKNLYTESTAAEDTTSYVSAMGAGTFTIGSNIGYDTTGWTVVAYGWKGGGTAVSNTSGSRTTSVSASTISGCSVVTGSVQGVNVQDTFGHGLGVTPQLIFVKDTSGTYNWCNFHVSVSTNTSRYLRFTTDAVSTYSTVWGAALPTSSVFGLTGDGAVGANHNFVAYCFTPVAGYSAFGSYTGNAVADGPFVYLGFRPKWILYKNSTTAGHNWIIYDSIRSTYNVVGLSLCPNTSSAENGNYTTSENTIDFLSNGFKARSSNAVTNGSADTIIYAAFAENPFNNSLAR